MITKFKLFEAKQVGILYHYTSLISYFMINRCDCLISNRFIEDFPEFKKSYNVSDFDSDRNYISFTRTKHFLKDNRLKNSLDKIINLRLTIDGNKLSNNYKIYPVNYFPDMKHFKEFEEAIIVDNEFKDLHKYLLKVEIPNLDNFKKEMYFYDENFEHSKEYYIRNISAYFGLDEECEYFFDEEREENNNNNEFIEKLYQNIINTIEYDNILKN